jgi:translation initiation factor 2 beta subunit (eIF-2beta)/eIF-5
MSDKKIKLIEFDKETINKAFDDIQKIIKKDENIPFMICAPKDEIKKLFKLLKNKGIKINKKRQLKLKGVFKNRRNK